MDKKILRAVNPASLELAGEYAVHNDAEINAILDKSSFRFLSFKHKSFDERATLLLKAAALLREKVKALGKMISLEMGKISRESEGEILKSAWVCEHYAHTAPAYLAPDNILSDAALSYVAYEPLGPILGIMPWNFPFWQVFRFVAPALMAGNTVIIKHAPNTPGCALEIEKLFLEAGFEEGVYQNVFLDDISPVASMIEDSRIRGVTLTGSVKAGRAVARLAAGALKPVVLELGGSDPFIILSDADLDLAVKHAMISRFLNAGQSCIAAKRIIVEKAIYAQFFEKFTQAVAHLKYGDPFDENMDLGPMARGDLRDILHAQVQASIRAGAKVVHGGDFDKSQKGYFYPPTLLTDVKPGMPVFDEEIFGPVACITSAEDCEQAIKIANHTCYGLGASLFTTSDRAKALSLIKKLNAGYVALNGMVKSDPRLPFGGIKDSGYGKELGRAGILSFTNAKTVWMG